MRRTSGSRVVGVVDYRAGNLASMINALEHVGATVLHVTDPQALSECSHAVLPGVGAFGHCAEQLARSGFRDALDAWRSQQRPLLGVCVGMQLMGTGSDESPGVAGLGWIDVGIRQLPVAPPSVRAPHVGWNSVTFRSASFGFSPGESADFYFDHGYAVVDAGHSAVAGVCHHGADFAAVLQDGASYAVQFHPEKSQDAGLRVLEAFLR